MSEFNDHIIVCPICGENIDMRDLSQVISHGNFNSTTSKYQCKKIEAPYSSSQRVGDAEEWTKDKKKIDLN